MQDSLPIEFRRDYRPDIELIAALYDAAPLRRPTADLPRLRQMYEAANVVLTAWQQGRLVGILRGWTDGAYHGYICDLAIAPGLQKAGIGRRLLAMALEMSPRIEWILRASVIAKDYYRHVGWERIDNGWFVKRADAGRPAGAPAT